MTKSRHGVLDPWIETGTEGVVWTVYENGAIGYEGMIVLRNGDHLKVYDTDNKVLFDDIIQKDEKIGYAPYPMNPDHGQPSALGLWIHWTQSGWTPDNWA